MFKQFDQYSRDIFFKTPKLQVLHCCTQPSKEFKWIKIFVLCVMRMTFETQKIKHMCGRPLKCPLRLSMYIDMKYGPESL